jgi:uroporphyrinogen-III synthase
VAVYATHPTDDRSVPERLSTIVSNGDVSAVTFTSRAAVDAITQPAIRLVELMGERDIVCACVGPVTASAARDAGFAHVISASPSRLGALVHALAQALAARGRDFEFDGIAMRLQGDRIAVSDRGARLTPRERVLLSALLDARGAVLSKQALSRIAWHGEAEEHTVEVTVNRLRRKLGPARRALETTPRRGYRLALTSQPRAGPCAQPVAGRS